MLALGTVLAPTRQASRDAGEKLRCVGSALSPNGLAFSPEGMLSLALLDKVLHIDEQKQQITVQAGARVQEVRAVPCALSLESLIVFHVHQQKRQTAVQAGIVFKRVLALLMHG